MESRISAGNQNRRRRQMRLPTAATAVIVLIALAGSAGAFTLGEWERFGYVMSTYDARTLAMGGAGLASEDGAAGMALNPALLGKMQGIDVAVTGMVVLAEEAREKPLHDSFDGVIGYNTYALNNSVYDRYVGAIAFSPSSELTELDWAPNVGIGYGPRLDMSYGYHVQYRDPDFQTEPPDKILYDYYAEGDGGVNAFTVALGQEVAPDVYVGLGVDFMRGDYEMSERWVYPVDSDEEDQSQYAEFDDVSGTRFTVGLLVERFHRLDVSAVYRGPFTLKGDYDVRPVEPVASSTGEFDHDYPGTFAIGVEYHPRNLLMTTVSCDVEYTPWSDFTQHLEVDGNEGVEVENDPDLSDVLAYRIGVEHAFFDDTFARFGFAYLPSYVEEGRPTAAFSLGLGLDVLGVRVDIGGQVGLREYEIEDGRVRETTTLAMATVTHTF
jgi:long-subunit fatty acid transport protein